MTRTIRRKKDGRLIIPEPKESSIQRDILLGLSYVESVPVYWRQNSGAIRIKGAKKDRYMKVGMKGVSDIIGILKDGRFLAIEVKTPKRRKQLTPEQSKFIDDVNDNGGVGFVATSFNEVFQRLKEEFQDGKCGKDNQLERSS